MSNLPGLADEDLHAEPQRADGVPGTVVKAWPTLSDGAISLADCSPFERIIARTRHSSYELIVISGRTGEILIRGGRFLPDFRDAVLVGSTTGGRALRSWTVDVGLHMELRLEDKVLLTSPVQSLSRSRND